MRSISALKSWAILFFSMITLFLALHYLLDGPLRLAISALFEQGLNTTEVVIASLLALVSDIVLPVPSSVVAVASTLNLGFLGGVLCVWVGLCLSCIVGYWLGASMQTRVLKRFFKKADLQQAQNVSERWGVFALVVLRAVPVMAETSVVIAGITRMPLGRFILVTALANAGIALLYATIAIWAKVEASFLLAFVASVALPGLTLLAWKKWLSKNSPAKKQAQAQGLTDTVMSTFRVDYSYPLHFTQRAFTLSNPCLANVLKANTHKPVNALFFVDEGVLGTQTDLQNTILAYCNRHNINAFDCIHCVPGGDACKQQVHIEDMYQKMIDVGLDRQSYVVAIGGGAVLDAVGYAAATFHRGIRLVRMPTTVLAQNDAGVGVKNGINARGIKNLYGSFAVPTAIINDLEFLNTLSRRDYRSGFAEAIKVALIRDGQFFYWIENNVKALNMREESAARYLIQRCAELHLKQICDGGDPFEQGSARPLDYGHWAAHKLEGLTQHELAHGEAVAIGMALDALYAAETGLCEQSVAEKVIELISALGFNVWHPALCWGNENGESALLIGLEEFRQHLGGELCITLLTGIGTTLEVNHIDTAALLRARDKLKAYENPHSARLSSELLQ